MSFWRANQDSCKAVSESPPESGAASLKDRLAGPLKLRRFCHFPSKPENEAEKKFAQHLIPRVAGCEALIGSSEFDLPTLPQGAMRLMQMLNQTHVSLGGLSEAIRYDPVLFAKFLKLANSSLYSPKRPIESIEHAINWLGLDALKGLVMTIALHTTMFKDKKLDKPARELWEHSISCATAAQLLAKDTQAPPEAAFMAGLFHDIGKLPGLMLIQKTLAEGSDAGIRPEFLKAMQEQFHIRLGLALAEIWRLPPEARLAVSGHVHVQTLEEACKEARKVVAGAAEQEIERHALTLGTVILADRVVASLGLGDEPGDLEVVGSPLTGLLGLMDRSVEQFIEALPVRLQKVSSLTLFG